MINEYPTTGSPVDAGSRMKPNAGMQCMAMQLEGIGNSARPGFAACRSLRKVLDGLVSLTCVDVVSRGSSNVEYNEMEARWLFKRDSLDSGKARFGVELVRPRTWASHCGKR